MAKFFKKLLKGVVGGGLGFLTGGPAGAALGAAGGLFSKGGGGGGEGGAYADVRSPAERQLAESQAASFQQRMGERDLGYKSEQEAEDPIYAREAQRMKQGIAGAAAEKGFGMLRQGPSLDLEARGLQEMGENRAAREVERRQQYKQWVMSGGRAAATPTGRSAYGEREGPSGFAAMMAPAMGQLGKQAGSNIGERFGQLTGGFANLFRRGGGGYPTGSPLGGASYT